MMDKTTLTMITRTIEEHRVLLGELDAAVGDGDHGESLARAMRVALDQLQTDTPPAQMFALFGRRLLSEMGGASGPMFGTLFIELGRGLADGDESVETVRDGLIAALGKIQALGGAEPGDKTLIDALHPAVEALSRAAEEGLSLSAALDEATRASRHGAEATKAMVAKRGRAKYVGDKSAGHQDAGATSCWLIMGALARSVGGAGEE